LNMEKLKFNSICARGAAGLSWSLDVEPDARAGAQVKGGGTKSVVRLRRSTKDARKEWKCHGNYEPEPRKSRNDSKRLAKAVKKQKNGFYQRIIAELTEPKQLF
jgi:hypothetical protein